MSISKILLIESDIHDLNSDGETLKAGGYMVHKVPTLAKARAYLRKQMPDMIISDIVLPDGIGVEFCKEVRSRTTAPLFFIVEEEQQELGFQALEAGADTYLIRPYSSRILLQSIRCLTRRIQIEREIAMNMLEFGPLTIDFVSRRAYLDGNDVLLKPKEFGVLFMLVRNKGKTCTSEEIYESVWGLPPNSDLRTIRVHVSNLRKKLKMDEESVIKISFTYGKGYCFTVNE